MDNLQQLQNHVSAENSSNTIARNELAPHSPWGPMTIIIASFLVMVICLATVGNLISCGMSACLGLSARADPVTVLCGQHVIF